jgi:oxygen-independent coproporphyrinogen-3 oxidase
MAGIYIHIPFCKQACNYCDFHFSTNLKNKQPLLAALGAEIEQRASYLQGKTVDTIYFGGGTPSLYSAEDIQQLIDIIGNTFTVNPEAEITLEANPDDLLPHYLEQLAGTAVNRLSIGLQSFYDRDLRFMNRAHTSAQSTMAVEAAQKVGFENITIDLIYGIPNQPNEEWLSNLEQMARLNIPHFSAYALTVEEGTQLHHQIRSGRVAPLDELQAAEQFRLLMSWAKEQGYEQYEISNFAKAERVSKHNSAYWQQAWYLGVGPSAHSYDGTSRQWNVKNNKRYMNAIQNGTVLFETEKLTLNDRFNEYIMTSLRTSSGIAVSYVLEHFGEALWSSCQNELNLSLKRKEIVMNNNQITLTEKGKLVADKIAANLFVIA